MKMASRKEYDFIIRLMTQASRQNPATRLLLNMTYQKVIGKDSNLNSLNPQYKLSHSLTYTYI